MIAGALALALAQWSSASAQPFGVPMGGSPKQFGALSDGRSGVFDLKPPPKPDDLFHLYLAGSSTETGICTIVADSEIQYRDAAGAKVRDLHRRIVAWVRERYGPPSQVADSLKPRARWSGADDFAMALTDHERELAATWVFSSPERTDGVTRITTQAVAIDATTTHVILNLQFRNYDQCKSELNRR